MVDEDAEFVTSSPRSFIGESMTVTLDSSLKAAGVMKKRKHLAIIVIISENRLMYILFSLTWMAKGI